MTDTDPILDLLRSFTVRHDPWRVEDALDALTVVPSGHVMGLTKALSDQDDELRFLAVEILYSMGDKAEAALPTLIHTLNDPDRIVRIAAVAPVAAFGRKAIAAVPILEEWLDCGDEFSEVTAAAAIIRIDPGRANDVLPVLVDALENDDFGIQCNAAWHLGQIGAVAEKAVPDLQELIGSDVSPLRCSAAEAIWRITGNPQDAIETNLELLDCDEWIDRCVGAKQLGEIGPSAFSAVYKLRLLLEDDCEQVRNEAAAALDEILEKPFDDE